MSWSGIVVEVVRRNVQEARIRKSAKRALVDGVAARVTRQSRVLHGRLRFGRVDALASPYISTLIMPRQSASPRMAPSHDLPWLDDDHGGDRTVR